jgi:hypothetical protein
MSGPDDSASSQTNGKAQQRRSTTDGRKQSPSPIRLAQRASEELAELVGREVEGIVSLQRSDDGWRVGVEVLEIARVPDTADVLAEYEVDADRRGRLMGYRRVRRYARGSTREQR